MGIVLTGEAVQNNKVVFTLLFFFLLCVITRAALADNYFFFKAYEAQPDGEQYQLKGYIAVRYSSSGGVSTGTPSHIQADRFFVPVKNAGHASRDTLFRGKSVLLRNTKATSASDKRESSDSTETHSSITSHSSLINMDVSSQRRRSMRSGPETYDQNDRTQSPQTCQASVINFVLGEEASSIHIEWIQNQETAATNKGLLTITPDDTPPQVLENISQSGLHEFIVVHELGMSSDEDRWIMENRHQELTDDDRASLGRKLEKTESEQLCQFKSAAALTATRSSHETGFPDPVWGTNCNWEHSAFFILDTSQIGWELINHTGDHQHVLMMPVIEIPAEVAGNFETIMGILDEEETDISIQHDVELPTTPNPADQTVHVGSDTLPPIATSPEYPSTRSRSRAVSFTIREGNFRRWEALHNPNYHNRRFFLNLIKGTISARIDIPFDKRQELKACLDGEITDKKIEELIELGIITRPKNTGGSSSNSYHSRRDDDPDPSGGATGNSRTRKQFTSITSHPNTSSQQSSGQKTGSGTSDGKTSKRLESIDSQALNSPLISWVIERVNLTEKYPLAALNPEIDSSTHRELMGVQSY